MSNLIPIPGNDLNLVRAILAKYERDLMDEDDEEALLLV